MKTFDDLVFVLYVADEREKQAVMNFKNGYGVSVLIGDRFCSNGIDTYELAVLFDGKITYNTPITDYVLCGLTKSEVTEAMKKVQELQTN